MESIVENLVNALGGIPNQLIVFIISLFPVLELRGGILAAGFLGMEMWEALPWCIFGNILPIPFILMFIEKIFDWMRKTGKKGLVNIVDKMEEKANKGAKTIMKHKVFGLFLFVGIPLPMTGAWTGALVAALFKFKLKESVPSIGAGVILASIIMCIITYGIPALIRMF